MKLIDTLYKVITVTGPLGILGVIVGSITFVENITLAGVILFTASIAVGFSLLAAERTIANNEKKNKE